MFQNTHFSWFPFLNDASDLSKKLFTRVVLVILEVRIQKKFLARRGSNHGVDSLDTKHSPPPPPLLPNIKLVVTTLSLYDESKFYVKKIGNDLFIKFILR